MKINKSILIWDNCEFTFIAAYLTQYFEKVYYYSRWESGFPYYGAMNISEGIEEVERINEPLMQQPLVDINFFTDIYFLDYCNHLKVLDKKCYGSGDMEMIERNRHLFYDLCVEADLPVPNTVFIKSYNKLMEYLKGKENLWVKLSEYRGSGETFQWVDDNFNEFFSLELKRQVGARGLKDPDLEFMVQEPIDTELEWGIDTDLMDSEFPDYVYMGFEKKGDWYFTKLMKLKDLPSAWLEVVKKFEKVIKKYHYTGKFSMEVRAGKDGKQYFIDPTVRSPYPGTASTLYMTNNYGQLLVDYLNGTKTSPTSDSEYGAEIVMRTSILNNWVPSYPEEEDKYMMVNNLLDDDDISYRVPPEQLYCDSLKYCSVVSKGDDLEKVIQQVNDDSGKIKSKGLEYCTISLEEVDNMIEQVSEKYNYTY